MNDASAEQVVNLSEMYADDDTRFSELAGAVKELREATWSRFREVVANSAASGSASYQSRSTAYRNAVGDLVEIELERTCSSGVSGLQRAELSFPLRKAQSCLLRDIIGNPFRPVEFVPHWRVLNSVLLAASMYESRDFSPMPVLADALEETGCDNADVLDHCRDLNGTHVRGCWVVDLVLGKS